MTHLELFNLYAEVYADTQPTGTARTPDSYVEYLRAAYMLNDDLIMRNGGYRFVEDIAVEANALNFDWNSQVKCGTCGGRRI